MKNALMMCALAAVLAACASAPPPPAKSMAQYTRQEASRLAFCMAMTDNVFTIAWWKLAGRPVDDIKMLYASQPESKLTVPLVEKVYEDPFTNRWDYTVAFFSECALNLANVPAPRSDMASYCVQNSMIAAMAREFKDANFTREKAQQQFDKMPATAHRIVDDVYASTKPRADLVHGVWGKCMEPLTLAK
jgi:hypothetical protein